MTTDRFLISINPNYVVLNVPLNYDNFKIDYCDIYRYKN